MGFVGLFFLTWLVILFFLTLKNKIGLIENTIIFLLLFIISVNFSWIVAEEMKLMTISKKALDYSGYLLKRSIIIPMIVLIGLHFYVKSRTTGKKILSIFISVSLLICLTWFANYAKVINYTKWNYYSDAVYFGILHLLAIAVYKIYKKIQKNVVKPL